MSTPASRPVHPCYVSVTKQGSRGVEFSTWAYLTHTRDSGNNNNNPQDALPNFVTAAGSSIHVYSHCVYTGKLKLEYSFPNVAGTIVFLATLTSKSETELDALLIGFGTPARLSVVTMEENAQGRLLQAVCLLDFMSVWNDHSCGAMFQEDAIFTLLEEEHTPTTLSATTRQPKTKGAPTASTNNNRARRPGLATVAVVLGGGVAVAVTELVAHLLPNGTHGWIAQEPYILPLHSLSVQLPHLRDSNATEFESGTSANNNNNETSPMATGWGDMFHAAFLSGYLEPVLVLLHSAPGGTTWEGRLARENTSGPPPLYLTALSISVSHGRTALLWSLPMTSDARCIMALSNGTSCLVLGTNTIVSVQAGRIHQVLAVNGWAHTTCPAVLKPELRGNSTVKLALQLDASQCCLINDRAALVVLRRGQVYLLQKGPGIWSLLPTGQSLSSMGEVAHLRSWPLLSSSSKYEVLSSLVHGTSKKTSTKEESGTASKKSLEEDGAICSGLIFAGSRLGDSLLLGYSVDTLKLPLSEIQPTEEEDSNEPPAAESLVKEEDQLKGESTELASSNGHYDDILAIEEEALYAPLPDQSDPTQSSPNLIQPSDDDEDEEFDSGNQSNSKRQRLTKCSVLRELVPLDRIVGLGPVGESCEGPLAAPKFITSAIPDAPATNRANKESTVFGSPAYIFPCGFGSSGGLALATAPGRDDRTILAEEDCLNVQYVCSLPSNKIVLLGMSPKTENGGIKLLRQKYAQSQENDAAQWEELEEWTDPRDEAMSRIAASSILLNSCEMGKDGTFCMLLQSNYEHGNKSSWRIAIAKWNADLLRSELLDEFFIDLELPDEALTASSPILSLTVENEEVYGTACRWSSGRASVITFSRAGIKSMVNVPTPEVSNETKEEDEETKRIREFYTSTNVVACDLFRAPSYLVKLRERDGVPVRTETKPEHNRSTSSRPVIHSEFDEDDMDLYGLVSSSATGDAIAVEASVKSNTLEDDLSGLSTFLALFRQSGMLELYEIDESNGTLVSCWACNGGERGLHTLVPSRSVSPLPFPRSHLVKIDEVRCFMCGPSLSATDTSRATNLRSLCFAMTASSGDFFLYTMKSGSSNVLEREQLYTQCRQTREQTRHRTKLMKKGIIPKNDSASDIYSTIKLHRFSDLSGQDGLFAALPQPKWIVCERGRPTTLAHRTRHSAPAGGKLSPVTAFCSPLPSGGFLTLHERVGRFGSQRLTIFKDISPVFEKAGVIPGGGLCIEKIAMGVTVRQIRFIDNPSISSGDHPLYAVLVSRELEVDQSDLNDDGMTAEERQKLEREKEEARIQRQVEADLGGFDVEQEWVEEIVRDDVFQVNSNLGGAPPIQKEFYSLWIVDAANEWRVVDSYDLEEYEHGLTLQVMELSDFKEEPGSAATEIEIEDLSTTTFITLGTGTLNHNGEDVGSKGRVLLFEVKKLDPSTMRRLNSQMVASLRLTYEKEVFHGPVFSLSCLSTDGKNRLVIGAGADVNLEQWGNGKLTQVGFFRATMQILNILLFKNFLLLSDAYDSLYFLVWRESDKSLTLLAKDYDPIAVYAAGIMSRGAAMTFLCHDDRQNVQFFQYAPGEAAARGGNKLVSRSDFHLGTQTTAFQQHYCRSSLLVHSATPASTVAALKQQDNYHGRTDDDQRLGVHFGTTDGSIGSLVPLSEPVYWRLAALQSVLANALESDCALSPRAWRLYRRSPRRGGCRSNDRRKGVIDGDLILRYADLPLTDQEDLASAIGSTVDLILDNLLELECGSLMI